MKIRIFLNSQTHDGVASLQHYTSLSTDSLYRLTEICVDGFTPLNVHIIVYTGDRDALLACNVEAVH